MAGMVQELVDPGTGAVLHGMISMLSEVLDGLDRRLGVMEGRLGSLADAVAAPRVAPEADAVADAVAALAGRVAALEKSLTDRVSGLDAAIAEQVGALSADVLEAGQRAAEVESAVAARVEAVLGSVLEPMLAPVLQSVLSSVLESSLEPAFESVIESIESAVGERLTRVESALAERLRALDDAVADRSVEVSGRVGALEGLVARIETSVGEQVAAVEGAVGERVAAVERAVGDRAAGVEAVVAERVAAVEAGVAERLGAVEAAVVDRVTAAVADHVTGVEVAVGERVAAVEAAVAEQVGSIEPRLADVAVRVEEVVQAAMGRRMAQIEASLAEARAEAEAAAARGATRLEARIDEATGRLAERIGQAEQAAAHHAETAAERIDHVDQSLGERIDHVDRSMAQRVDALTGRVDEARDALAARIDEAAATTGDRVDAIAEPLTLQLGELDAALAALRAEAAAVPANVGDQVQQALGSWRNRLRRGGDDDAAANAKTLEALGAITTEMAQLTDGLTRIHDAVNRAQGESLEAAQTTTAEVRRLLDAARADGERQHSEALDGAAAIAERLVTLHEDLSRRDARLAQALKHAAESTTNRIAEAEQALTQALAADDGTDDEVRAWLTDELNLIRDAIHESHVRAGSIAATVGRQVDQVVQAAAAALQDRLSQERTGTDGIRRDVELLGSRIEELGKSVSAGRREFAITAQGLPELISSVMPAIDVDAITAADKAVLDAVNAANHDHQEVLQALHASLAKRFDARTRAIAETLDGLGASLEAARTLGPSLDKVSTKLESQQPHLDQIRSQLVQLAATVTSVPADVERRHTEATAALDRVTDGLGALRKHAAALDRAVQAMRTSQDGLSAAFVDLRDGNGVLPQRLDQIGMALDATRRQLSDIAEATRTLTAAGESQQATGNRIAELVTQVRAATRSDIERVESSIHLEVLKQHQQDQARLTQAVAGVSEVVEREAGVIAQRVSALANEVDAIRLELSARQDTP